MFGKELKGDLNYEERNLVEGAISCSLYCVNT